MLRSLIVSLVLTLMIELPVLYILGVRCRRDIRTAVYANVLTNPPVVFAANLLLLFVPVWAWALSGVLEGLVVLVEGFVFYKNLKFNQVNPWALALVANLISFETGLIIRFLRG